MRDNTKRSTANIPVPKSKNSARFPLSNKSVLGCPSLLLRFDIATTPCKFDIIPTAREINEIAINETKA